MGNSKIFGGIGIGVVIVAIIAVYASNQDQSEMSNEIVSENALDSSVAISDSVTLTQNNPNFVIDEDGNKRFIISVSDSPVLED